MKTLKRRGGGIKNTIRKLFTKKNLKPRNLTKEEKSRKARLFLKPSLSKQEKENLSILRAKLGPYEETNVEAKPLEENPIEGLINSPKNIRNPFNRQKAKIPNENIEEPPIKKNPSGYEINGEFIELAGQSVVEYLNAPLLYSIWSQKTRNPINVPASLKEIPDEEYAQFTRAVNETNTIDDGNEKTRALFSTAFDSIDDLERWRKEHEEGLGWPATRTVVRFKYVFDDGTILEKPFIKVPGAATVDRLFGDYGKSKDILITDLETDLAQCPDQLDVNNIPSKTRKNFPIFTPLTTLKSNGCINILNSLEGFYEQTSYRGNLAKNWIVFDPTYVLRITAFIAKYFKSLRLVKKAFDNWGVLAIDPALFELFQIKYPELAIKISTYFINTKDFAYQQNKLKPFDNYIVLDKTVYADEIGLTVRNPFKDTSKFYAVIQQAVNEKKLYGMSTYVAYIMKRLARDLWMNAFPFMSQPTFLYIYDGLTDQEKITVDYLQNLRWSDALSATEFNFQKAQDTYKDYITEEIKQKLIRQYLLEYPKHKKQLAFYQQLVIKEYEGEVFVEKTTKKDIEAILDKFVGKSMSSSELYAPRLNETVLAISNEKFVEPRPERKPRVVLWGNEEVGAPAAAASSAPRTVPPRGAFNEAGRRNVSAEQVRLLKRKQELEDYLASAQKVYNNLLPRLANLEGRSRFLQTKKRYGALANSETKNLRNYQVLKNFPTLKERAEEELARIYQRLAQWPE